MASRVYLAGPDVFLPEAVAWAARKQAICAAHGLIGVAPLDPAPLDPAPLGPVTPDAARAALPEWRAIAAANEAHIRGADALIANLTPFRGPSADAGTVYELGFMRALGRPVFGYVVGETRFTDRTRHWAGDAARQEADGTWRDDEAMAIEDFGLWDNLMIEAGIAASGGVLIVGPADPAAGRWHDLSIFERCVIAAAAHLLE